ncbi:MAG: TrmH family RNA methyltransferase [Spirochaetaceae bacterium]
MITIKKLNTLKEGTRFRKYIVILQGLEKELTQGTNYNKPYYLSVLKNILSEEHIPNKTKSLITLQIELRIINSIRHSIMGHLKVEPSEWDFIAPLDNQNRTRKEIGINIFLDDIRSPFNLGSIFRTAECFGVSTVLLSENTTDPGHNRAIRTSMGCIDLVNWQRTQVSEIEGPIFALELGGTSINKFKFPKTGTVIIGSEELGVSPDALKLADKSLGRVSIPLLGSKSSLNVANATSILLQRWQEYILEG